MTYIPRADDALVLELLKREMPARPMVPSHKPQTPSLPPTVLERLRKMLDTLGDHKPERLNPPDSAIGTRG